MRASIVTVPLLATIAEPPKAHRRVPCKYASFQNLPELLILHLSKRMLARAYKGNKQFPKLVPRRKLRSCLL